MAEKNNGAKSVKQDKNKKTNTIVFAALCVLLVVIVGALFINMYGNDIRVKLSSASNKNDTGNQEEKIIEITEKLYVSWINEIYTATQRYTGRKIKIEGMFAAETASNKTYYYVYRVGPGCCGNDGAMCGFEFTTDGEYPKENDWIEVIGTLEVYEENGAPYLTLSNSKVTVKQERGLETVGN